MLRQVTERPEAVEAGAAKVVGTHADRIVAETSSLLDDEAAYLSMARAPNPFGDGHAADRIATALLQCERGSGGAGERGCRGAGVL